MMNVRIVQVQQSYLWLIHLPSFYGVFGNIFLSIVARDRLKSKMKRKLQSSYFWWFVSKCHFVPSYLNHHIDPLGQEFFFFKNQDLKKMLFYLSKKKVFYKLVTKIKLLSFLFYLEAAVKSKDDDTASATLNHVHEKWQIALNSV